MLPNLDSIQLFLCAVQAKSISKAAEINHISLSAASRRLSLLEQRFGVTLLERRADGVSPTAAGEAMVVYAEGLLQQVEQMRSALSDYAGGAMAKVHLAANVSALSHQLPEQLAAWSRQFPNIRIEICEARSAVIVDWVRQGIADIGIVTATPEPGLKYTAYVNDPLCAIVPFHHPWPQPHIRFEDLLDNDFIGLDKDAASTQQMARQAQALGRPLNQLVQVQSFDAMCRLVAAEQGVAVLPTIVASGFRQPSQFRLLVLQDDWAQQRKMYLCTRHDPLPAPVAQFLHHLLQPLVA
ncbi:LysR family transcriptional regulator [Lampropedia puyangensis]|uniref:LysR family transcriptional regulator n=1 Tax=Lampropedia puyangensis TaxID=1330072 RepID=A0A4V4GSA4_9BURK|nr:LysR family transcriptional regulator [Lampropedia puyangensis]THU03686.1 LysR family transcriptional regulator [Lampropedia puyangensis]